MTDIKDNNLTDICIDQFNVTAKFFFLKAISHSQVVLCLKNPYSIKIAWGKRFHLVQGYLAPNV